MTCVTWMHRRVVLWDWELMYFQAYVYTIFVYRVVYVDMSTRSSQLNHLNRREFTYLLACGGRSLVSENQKDIVIS